MPVNLILLILALRLVPADVTSIHLQFNDAAVIQATKHADGGWRVPSPGKKEEGVYTVNGLQVKLKSGANEQTIDLSKLADVNDKTDWASLKEVKAPGLGATIQVERVKDALLLKCVAPQGNLTHTLTVSWGWARDPT
jgi:hypothetical protein